MPIIAKSFRCPRRPQPQKRSIYVNIKLIVRLLDSTHSSKRTHRLFMLLERLFHYENLPMQYIEIFSPVKIENFQWKIFDIFLIFAQNIDCGYTLEPPRRGGSNEYPPSMFWSKNKKNRYTPAYPSFAI